MHSDFLFLICELAAVFAGFTAIVSALGSGPETSGRYLISFRLRQMLELSLLTVAGGLMPYLLSQFGFGESLLWRIAAGVMVVAGTAALIVQARRGFDKQLRSAPGYNLPFGLFLLSLGMLTLASFTLALFAVAGPQSVYLLGVTLLMAIAALQFLRTCTAILRLPSGRG